MLRSIKLSVALLCVSLAANRVLAQDEMAHAADGGTMQRIQSVVIPPLPDEPFSATVSTEWTRVLPDGTTSTLRNHRMVARDGQGRVFEERRYLTPHGDTEATVISELDIRGPVQHKMYVCKPVNEVCLVYRYYPRPAVQQPVSINHASVVSEALGRKWIDDVEVIGSRETKILAAGAFGNEKPQPIVKEFWFAPRLGINVVTKRFDPRASAVQNFEVRDISLAEPDAKLFSPPNGYRLVSMDARQTQ